MLDGTQHWFGCCIGVVMSLYVVWAHVPEHRWDRRRATSVFAARKRRLRVFRRMEWAADATKRQVHSSEGTEGTGGERRWHLSRRVASRMHIKGGRVLNTCGCGMFPTRNEYKKSSMKTPPRV